MSLAFTDFFGSSEKDTRLFLETRLKTYANAEGLFQCLRRHLGHGSKAGLFCLAKHAKTKKAFALGGPRTSGGWTFSQ